MSPEPLNICERVTATTLQTYDAFVVFRAQKCNALVGADTAFSSAGPQTTLFHGGQYRAENGNMRNFEPSNPHGTILYGH